MSFAPDLQRFAEKAKEKADEAVGAIVVNIARRIDERSPVGDPTKWDKEFVAKAKELGWIGEGYIGGHFRANWQLGIDVRPAGEIAGVDPSGEATQGKIVAAVPDEAAGHVYYLVNNAPYARRLEEGYSKQAPQGMVGLTVVEFQSIADVAVRTLQ